MRKIAKYSVLASLLCFVAYSCVKPETPDVPVWPGDDPESPDPNTPPAPGPGASHTVYPQIQASFDMPVDEHGGIILDFSRVGYHWGDKVIPDVPVVKTIEAPEGGADATSLIKNAIAEVAKMPLDDGVRGAILLKAGLYNVTSTISIMDDGIVIRGEGPQTRIVGVGKRSVNIDAVTPTLFAVGTSSSRSGAKPAVPNVVESYVPEGRFWVRVKNPGDFAVRDQVVVYRDVNAQWLKDLGMSSIWTLDKVNRQYAERVVTRINRDTLWFENPIPCALDINYGGGYVYKYSYSARTSEVGIENLTLESEFFANDNEAHCWQGVTFNTCIHCWMRNVTGKYFGFGLAYIKGNAKNITVKDCDVPAFQGKGGGNDGSRRYPYLINGQLCLVQNCNSADSRHAYATSGSESVGPNVFTVGKALRSTADVGPHRCWATGTLYDNLDVEGQFNIRNRYTNSNHGWAGANNVAWNSASKSFPEISWSNGFIIQSPQVSGKNYCIGCVGAVKTNTFDAGCTPASGQGVFISHGVNVSPASLYDAQLALRKENQPGGVFDVK